MEKESERIKIQVFADYCHTNFTFRSTLIVTAFVGLLLIEVGLTYQGLLPLLAYYISLAIVGVFFYYFLRQAFTEYHNNLDKIQGFLSQVEKNEALPTLKEMRRTSTPKKSTRTSDKNDSGKLSTIAVIISILSLVASIVFSSYGYGLATQANELTKKNLELQNILSNFTSVIIAKPETGFLYSSDYSYLNGSIHSVTIYGHLNVSLKVITPHYGKVSIEIKNFIEDSEMLNPTMRNETRFSYVWEKYEDVVVTGLNPLTADLLLKATVYPDSQKLPAKGEQTQFPLGQLYLEAKLFDVQTNKTSATEEFPAFVAAIITVPWT